MRGTCRGVFVYIVKTLRNYDGVNEQNNISLLSLDNYSLTTTWNDLILSLLENGNGRTINSTIDLCLNSGAVSSLQLQPKCPSFSKAGRIGIIAKKFKRMRSLFFCDVFMDFAVVGTEAPGIPKGGFLLNTLKTAFRLSRVLLDL